MIVDDDPSIRKFMDRVLRNEGYLVFTAVNGRDGMEQVQRIHPDLIILDMDMPEMTGLDFLKVVRNGKITSAPVLILSGTTDLDMIIESYAYGVYDFIRKPEHTGVMLKRVRNGIEIGKLITFNEYMRIELGMARGLQRNLYPQPELESDRFILSAWNMPLTDIGGDLYDYIQFRDGRLMFIVADVSGHSISAALFISIVKMVFRNALKKTDDPGSILTEMNHEMTEHLGMGLFVTLFCGLLDPVAGILKYASAGHPFPCFFSNTGTDTLDGAGPFMGPIHDAVYETYTRSLHHGNRLLVYTDGIIDSFDSRDSNTGRNFIVKHFSDFTQSIVSLQEQLKGKVLGAGNTIIDDCTSLMIEYK